MLLADGVEQSYVDVADPRHLHFDYVRRMASVADAAAPKGAALSTLHLGGGALTLPRYLAATRPGRLPVARITTAALRDPIPGVVLHGPALERFVAGAVPATDADTTTG